MITAEEARKISETNVQKHLKDAYNRIQEAAYAGKRKVTLQDPFWSLNSPAYWITATDELKRQGFRVSFLLDYSRTWGTDDGMGQTVVEW